MLLDAISLASVCRAPHAANRLAEVYGPSARLMSAPYGKGSYRRTNYTKNACYLKRPERAALGNTRTSFATHTHTPPYAMQTICRLTRTSTTKSFRVYNYFFNARSRRRHL